MAWIFRMPPSLRDARANFERERFAKATASVDAVLKAVAADLAATKEAAAPEEATADVAAEENDAGLAAARHSFEQRKEGTRLCMVGHCDRLRLRQG